jgi:hypothetical protein
VSDAFLAKYFYSTQTEDELGGTCGTHWREETFRALMGKAAIKKPLGRSAHRWEDNIKICYILHSLKLGV